MRPSVCARRRCSCANFASFICSRSFPGSLGHIASYVSVSRSVWLFVALKKPNLPMLYYSSRVHEPLVYISCLGQSLSNLCK